MSFAKLIRPAGLVSIFAGVLIALAEILHPAGEDLVAVHSPLWSPAHMVWWLGVLLLQFGLIGLYARHAEAVGWLGLTGFVMVFFGAGLTEVSFGGGIVLFALATMRARVYPRWAGLLVIYGIVLYLASWVPPDRVLSHAIALA